MKIFMRGYLIWILHEIVEVKGDLEEGCSSRDEFDDEYLQVFKYFHRTRTCLEIINQLIIECTSSFHGHEIKYIEDI